MGKSFFCVSESEIYWTDVQKRSKRTKRERLRGERKETLVWMIVQDDELLDTWTWESEGARMRVGDDELRDGQTNGGEDNFV